VVFDARRCRELGVRKWPHRRLRSIEELYTYVADVFQVRSPRAESRRDPNTNFDVYAMQKVVLVSISSKPKIEKSLAQLDNDVRGLMRDLEALRAHAEDLVRRACETFFHVLTTLCFRK